jgi:hypothetical protein
VIKRRGRRRNNLGKRGKQERNKKSVNFSLLVNKASSKHASLNTRIPDVSP